MVVYIEEETSLMLISEEGKKSSLIPSLTVETVTIREMTNITDCNVLFIDLLGHGFQIGLNIAKHSYHARMC